MKSAHEGLTRLPMVIEEWRRSDREIVRVTLHDDVIDLRAFYRGDDEEPFRAARHGLTLPVAHLPALHTGIAEAYREARRRRLIDGGRNE